MPNTVFHLEEDEASEIVGGYDGWIATQEVDQHRWYTKQLIVFDRDGETYGFYYDDPATELQEDQDRFEDIPVPVFEVVGKPVTTTFFKPKG